LGCRTSLRLWRMMSCEISQSCHWISTDNPRNTFFLLTREGLIVKLWSEVPVPQPLIQRS
jgi:hypothetical protein